MTTATKQETVSTDQLWRDVQLADARRQEVRARIDAVAEQIGAAGKRLAQATEDSDREEIRSELAGLNAEAAVLPVEFAANGDPYATALHLWAKRSLEEAKAIESKANGAANAIFERQAEEHRTLELIEEGSLSANERREAMEKVSGSSRTAITMRASAAAERLKREAAEKAKPIRQRVSRQVRPIFGSPRRAGRVDEGIGELVGGCLTGHERWLERERIRAEEILSGGAG